MPGAKPRKPPKPVPSVPDAESEPPHHDEPLLPTPEDRMPEGVLDLDPARSKAELRILVERLLERREPPSREAWDELGPDAIELLAGLLDDTAVARNRALYQRVIATLGELQVKAAIPRLGQILVDRRADPITRAYAASAIGRLEGGAEASRALAQAVSDHDDVVRRQVALALARTDHPDALPHLVHLSRDPAKHVADAAAAALAERPEELAQLGIRARRPSAPRTRRGPLRPKPEE